VKIPRQGFQDIQEMIHLAKKEKKQETEDQVTEETVSDTETAAETNENPDAENPAEDKTAEFEAALSAERDKYLRLAAEYDNFRKRTQKEREAIYADVKSSTVLELLPVYDNLERALALECKDEAFYKGVELTMTQLKNIFEKLGVTEIEALGKTFDPSEHNAVMHIEDEKYGEKEIVAEFQKGFKLGDKVIRFSVVQVAN
jgi:molecular chaperone GrpE